MMKTTQIEVAQNAILKAADAMLTARPSHLGSLLKAADRAIKAAEAVVTTRRPLFETRSSIMWIYKAASTPHAKRQELSAKEAASLVAMWKSRKSNGFRLANARTV